MGSRRLHIHVEGIVQGVGFRPFVYNLAEELRLAGWVLNDSHGVDIEVEGALDVVECFRERLESERPPLSVIIQISSEELPPAGFDSFVIRKSEKSAGRTVLVSPDVSVCADCLREMFDPNDRRHLYPFINCTNCGPRYTIIRDVPYDRPNTTMAAFPMCDACRREYEDPSDRRFHAQPVACPDCGPTLKLLRPDGSEVASEDPVREVADAIASGLTVAVKGLGGYHLAADAANSAAVKRLRARKMREEKPLAVMTLDIAALRRFCVVSAEEQALLEDIRRPIVLCRKLPGNVLCDAIAPKRADYGVMLPYTPLHYLLLKACDTPALVMTSGNATDEPIAHLDDDALHRLAPIADLFLAHDREIHIRTDDSIACVVSGKPAIVRRARGYAPRPVFLPQEMKGSPSVLAVGAELANTICLTRGVEATLSHHIGDLTNEAAFSSFLQAVEHLRKLLGVEPCAVACDLHPEYLSTRWAVEESGLPVERVQHHHAHIVAVMAEHGLSGDVIGLSLDGTGLGTDEGTWKEGGPKSRAIWGGEFLVCDERDFRRRGHLGYVPLPGGDAAIKRPDRMAYAYLWKLDSARAPSVANELLPTLGKTEIENLTQMCEGGFRTRPTSSTGRLFDAVSALLGICTTNTYEAQAPGELEGIADRDEQGAYEFPLYGLIAQPEGVIEQVVKDVKKGTPASVCSARFHNSVARLLLDVARALRDETGLSRVVLGGGVFFNALLLERASALLEADRFEVYSARSVPAGDGCVALGQAACALARKIGKQNVPRGARTNT